MQKKIYIIFLLILFTKSSFALTRGDVEIIEARENIQYLGQKITTDYFLLYKKPTELILKDRFQENVKEIEKNIQNIRKNTQNPRTLNILSFYDYRLEYIKKLPLEAPTPQDAKLILSASNYFLEGARAISEEHQYDLSKEESILIHYKELKYLVERVSKDYMAFQIGLSQSNYDIEMRQSIQGINKNLKSISNYHYPYRLKDKLTKIKHIWKHNQKFFRNLKESSFTNLLLSSNSYLKTLLIDFEKYHRQKL